MNIASIGIDLGDCLEPLHYAQQKKEKGLRRGGGTQHVMCRIALVLVVSVLFLVYRLLRRSAGSIVQSYGRLASAFTSFISGRTPVPVPTTRRRHFHGIPSSSDSGVCPKASRNFFEAFFFRFRTLPRSMTTFMVVARSIHTF